MINIQHEIHSANEREEDGRSNSVELEELAVIYWI